MIYTVRTTSGRETIVIDMLEPKVKAEKLGIKTIFHPAEIKGYIFIEGNLGEVQKAIRGVMHVRGLIEKPVKLMEIQRFLEQKKELIRVGIGDTVEIIGGPFKGEKGKINRVDTVKHEVTVELLEATIPIPVTIATEFIKVIKSVKKEARPEEAEEEKPKEEEPSVFEGLSEEEPEKVEEEKPEGEVKEEAVPEKPEEEKPAPEQPQPEADVPERAEEPKEAVPEVAEKPEEPKSILEKLEEEKKKKKKGEEDDKED